MGVGDGGLGLEVSRATVVNNNKVRLDHFMDNTDRAMVTSVVSLTVDTLLSHNHRPGSPPYNMTNFMVNFKVSLWFPHHDDLPHPPSMVVGSLATVARGSGCCERDDEAIQEEGPDTPHGDTALHWTAVIPATTPARLQDLSNLILVVLRFTPTTPGLRY